MRTCKRLIDFIQIINAEGDVRVCGWNKNNIIGNLQKNDIQEILNSNKANEIRKHISQGDFSNCDKDNCPYLSNDNMEDMLVEYNDDETIYPKSLYLAYEGNCNYNCTCCTSYMHMEDTRNNNYTELYDVLEVKLKPILPYVKHIGANGRGELFASPRIMKLLSEWKPLAPKEEISVGLETNGSLFNEHNWKKIENLGQYNLSVTITVMSFHKDIYQFLSGTKQPIEQLINCLHFVKGLRKKGIVNKFVLATVLQEMNFREMPEFTQRCLEEFGADTVRIRPIFPGGYLSQEAQWFMDVRNPQHPYYEMYRKVMEHPIFQDPRVLLWSNDLPSEIGQYPLRAEVNRLSDISYRQNEVLNRIKQIMDDDTLADRFVKLLDGKELAIYGLGAIGKVLVLTLLNKMDIFVIYDKCADREHFYGIPVRNVKEAESFDGTVIITPYARYEEMKRELLNTGYSGEIFNIEEILAKAE